MSDLHTTETVAPVDMEQLAYLIGYWESVVRIDGHNVMATAQCLRELESLRQSAAETGPREHRWDRDGERCLDCGDKDWMGGPCSGPRSSPEPAADAAAWAELRETGLDYHCTVRAPDSKEKVYFTLRELANSHKQLEPPTQFKRGTAGNPHRCDNCGLLTAQHDVTNAYACPAPTKGGESS